MRLIDATRLVQLVLLERDKIPLTIVMRYSFGTQSPNHHGQSMRGGIRKVLRLIEQAPTIDAVPVVHARWIMNHFGAKCSHCLRLYCMEPSWSEKIKHMPPTWIYCPNCGAKMDGEADE